jgi:hypothetical protein
MQAPHVLLPPGQLSTPAPFVMAQGRVPSGLAQARWLGSAGPQAVSPVGVQARSVTSAPHRSGAPSGVQACCSGGGASAQRSAGTSWPRRSTQRAVRTCDPLPEAHAQAPVRDSRPLSASASQRALRASVPAPLHTALAEQLPQAP